MVYSDAYVEHLLTGPFPGQVDPWAEVGNYFHQIHGSMISSLLDDLQRPLNKMGYIASREASLQIAEQRQPDVAIRQEDEGSGTGLNEWSYRLAAEQLLLEPGVAVRESELELEAIYIRSLEGNDLITIVEIISPSNKKNDDEIEDYKSRRRRLVHSRGVNVVEVDLTRSIKRLVRDVMVSSAAYHIALHLPEENSRIIGMGFAQPLKSFALPLHQEVIGVDTQANYDRAYRQVSAAAHIRKDGHYIESELPFPSLLTSDQRREALEAVKSWQAKLAELREEQG